MSVFLIWFVIILRHFIFGVEAIDCPANDLHFEKVLGIRPSINNENSQLLFRSRTAPVTKNCIEKCRENDDCASFVLNFHENSCYSYQNLIDIGEYSFIFDNNVAWFTKTCLHDETGNCEKLLWVFERIPGTILIGNDTEILQDKLMRNECQQKCISTKEFECKSAKFRIRGKDRGPNAKGSCILSDADRHLLPNSFRVAREYEEYFENQCVKNDNPKNEFCAYEEYVDANLHHIDAIYEDKTKKDCETLCDNFEEFHCRGFSLRPSKNGYFCLLHSEDTKIFGPNLLEKVENGLYFEKARCLNISVTCTEKDMTISYHPEIKFSGRIYLQGNSDMPDCSVKGRGFEELTLKVPLHSSHCGIIEALSPDKRKLLSGNLIIQYNNFIQTQGDRLIRVGCIFTNDSKIVIGTGVNVVPDKQNNGSILTNSTSTEQSTGENPLVQMKIVDHQTGKEVSDTEIGQELDLIIESSSTGNFELWAGHLVSMTADGLESLLLLDDRGCPTDLNIFPRFSKIKIGNKAALIATFQAFKFSSSPAVRFSVIVQFCPEKCPDVDCSAHIRTKRAEIENLNGTRISQINRSDFENLNSQFSKNPLEFIMIVRNQNLPPDKLAIGTNKVLVAGYNYETNEVCVDYSLLLGMIISWVLIQIIFAIICLLVVRKYKRYYRDEYYRQAYEEYNKNLENFGIGASNLDSRRVRWADSGDDNMM